MKRFIVTTSVIVTFLGLALTASPYLLKLIGIDRTVKNYILSELIDDSQGKIDVQNFQIGFGKLTLRNVSLSPADQKFQLSLNAIEFAFNFWEIFSKPGKPEHAIEAIYLNEPHLILSSSSNSEKSSTITSEEIRKIFNNISKLSTVDNIQIKDGKIIWVEENNKKVTLVDDLSGRISTNNPENVILEAKGNIFSSSSDVFFINSIFDFSKNYADATVLIKNYEVSENLESLLPDGLKLMSGEINGTLSITTYDFKTDSTKINGNLNLDHFVAEYDEHNINNLISHITIQDNKLFSETGQFNLDNSPVYWSINISNLLRPEPEISADITNLNLVKYKKHLHTSLFDRAQINGMLKFNWSDSIPTGIIKLSADRLELTENESINNFNATLSADPKRINLKSLTGTINNFEFSGLGGYGFDTGLLSLHFESDHDFGYHQIFDRLTEQKLDFGLDLVINTKETSANGNWTYAISDTGDTTISASGIIKGENGKLVIAVVTSNSEEFSAQAEILNYLDKPEISSIQLINFPLNNFTSNKILKSPLERYNSDIKLFGDLGHLTGNIDIVDKKNYKNHFSLKTEIKNILTPKREINGTVKLKNVNGNYNFTQSNDYLEGVFEFPGSMHGDLVINLKDQDQILSRIEFNHFRIFNIIADSTLLNRVQDLAELNGKVHISGSTSKPKVEAELAADKIVINEQGYYQAEFNLEMLGSDILSDSLVFYLNNLPILEGSLSYNSESQSINGHFSGNEIDVEPIMAAILPESQVLTGTGKYDLNINGTINQPLLSGSLQMMDGVLQEFAFDKLAFNFADSLKENGSIFKLGDHVLKFSNLEFIKTGKINLTASGSVPFNKTDPLYVKGEFVGDILHFIPKASSFFRDATSISEVGFELGGSPGRVRFKSGYVDIERGELWLDKVAPYIQNINGRIELENGTNKVDFRNLVAWVDDQKLTINTVRDITLSTGEKLESWYFKGWDLDFGILQLETTERGVQVNIPGLMEDNEYAQMKLTGMENEPYFYFAGPTKHPRLRGIVTLYNTRFTYPFNTTPTPGEKPSVVVEFLENMDWDIIAHSGEDVVYYRDIPAYFDKVYAEVYIDETSPGIHFKGIINKGTFHPIGKATSSRGRLEYLDQNFRVERFAVEFTQNDVFPYVSGRAWTSIRDSVGAIPKTIYLQLYAIDPETKEEKQQGSWEDFKFKLVSQDPQIGETQEQVLAYLGFSVGNIKEKATSVGGAVTERYLIRPLLRPVERALEKGLGVDLVRINSNIAKNLFYNSVGSDYRNKTLINPFASNTPYLFLMQSSELTVGKYLSQNLYLTYTGQLVSIYDQTENTFDFNHSFGLEYRFLRNVLLEFEYDRELLGYYRIPNQKEYLEDFKIRLRHSFAF